MISKKVCNSFCWKICYVIVIFVNIFLYVSGKVEVNIGREELIFEGGPFSYYGIQTLNQVIESPSSPMIQFKSNNIVGTPSSATSGNIKHLRKTSTQQSIEVNPNILNKRHSAQAEMGMGKIFLLYNKKLARKS